MALTDKLSAIGNAIRSKTGSSDRLLLDEMPSEILSIETSSQVNLQTKRVAPSTSFQQVTYDAADGYTGLSRVEIEAIQTQSKDIYRNGTYTPDTGKFFDSVTVNILTDAKLGNATEYTFGQIGIMQTSVSVSFNIAETIHVEDGEIVLDNATSQTFTMRSSDTSGSCFNGLRGLYFQKSGTTYYVPPDCSIVRSAVKGSGNATTAYAYKGSIYPVIGDAGTVMGTKNITENGTYYASDDGFDGFESVNVNVDVELPPIEVSRRGAASDLASGKQLYDEYGNLITGTVREITSNDFYVDDEFGVKGEMLTASMVSATWPVSEDTLFRKGVPVDLRFPVSQLGISSDTEERLNGIDLGVADFPEGIGGDELYVEGTVDEAVALNSGAFVGMRIPATQMGSATADDVAAGETFTSKEGFTTPGAMEKLENSLHGYNPKYEIDGEYDFFISFDLDKKKYLDGNVLLYDHASIFGEAKLEDVRAGITFTSKNGLKATGTRTEPQISFANGVLSIM